MFFACFLQISSVLNKPLRKFWLVQQPLPKLLKNPCNAGFLCRFCNCCRNRFANSWIKSRRYNIISSQLFIRDQTCNRFCCCYFHFLIDIGSVHVKNTTEYPREGKHIVHLIRKIASASCYY